MPNCYCTGGNGSVFLPAVLPPAADKNGSPDLFGPTLLDAHRIRVFSTLGGDEEWILPLSWVGKKIECRTISMDEAKPVGEWLLRLHQIPPVLSDSLDWPRVSAMSLTQRVKCCSPTDCGCGGACAAS